MTELVRGLRAWLRWRREVRQLRRVAHQAYNRWVRARHAYSDTAIIFAGQTGAWGNAGPCGKAQQELTDRMNEYTALARKAERLEETGPTWTT
jgi:hypothetical protein